MVETILVTSVLLQLHAAGVALWLIRVTGRRLAWIVLAIGITLMLVRRSISAYRLLSGDPTHVVDVSAEVVALMISGLLCVGMAMVVPLFQSMMRATAELAESQRTFSTLVSNLPGMAYRCRNDQYWTMEFVSEGCTALTGYEPADLVNNRTLSFADLIHPDDQQSVREEVQSTLDATRPFRLVYRIRNKASDERWVLELGRGVLDAEGHLRSLEGFISDITERKNAEEALALSDRRSRKRLAELDRIYDAAPVGLCIVDTDLRFVRINQRLAAIDGVSVEQHIGRTLREVIPEFASTLERLYRAVIDTGRPIVDMEVQGVTPAYPGEERSYLVNYYPVVVDQKTVGVGAVVYDVTERNRTQQKLRESEARLATLIRFAPDGITLLDVDLGRFVDANDEALAMFECTREELLKLAPWQLSPPVQEDGRPTREVAEEHLAKVAETGRQEVFEWTHRTPSGREFPAEIRLVRLPATDRRLIRGSVIDISERKRAEAAVKRAQETLESRVVERTADLTAANDRLRHEIQVRESAEAALRESEQRIQAVLDNSTAVIYVKDLKERYILANRRYAEAFDVPHGQIVGHTDHELHPKEMADIFVANDREVLDARHAVDFEETANQSDGVHTYISLKFPLFDETGEPYAVCGMSTDITERKRAAGELRSAMEAAEAANRAKSAFLANISHEIRTPITALLGAAEMLGAAANPDTGVHDHASMVLRNGRHLLNLIDDLLDLSRAEAGELSFRAVPCPVEELFEDVVAVTGPLHRRAEVDFRIDYDTSIPSKITTDPTRLKQALINLVNNALKFTKQGHVRMRVTCPRTEPNPKLTVVVEDTGVGISDADAKRVFEPFAQADPIAAGIRGGVGLGLPLARTIAEKLGGGLELSRHGSDGCAFTLRVATGARADTDWIKPENVRVDVRGVPHTTRSVARAVKRSRYRLHGSVLVAEDFADTRRLISEALTACGVSVVAVDNGRDALAAAAKETFDLILMDIRMPGLSGSDATRELRKRRYLAPIIALTASTMAGDRDCVMKAGFDDFWAKPITMEHLLASVGEYLRSDESPDGGASAAGDDHERRERMAEAIAGFVATLPDRLAELRAAIRTGNSKHAREILHQLIGAGGLHGLMPLSREAARLHAMVAAGTLSGPEKELSELSELVRKAQDSALT